MTDWKLGNSLLAEQRKNRMVLLVVKVVVSAVVVDSDVVILAQVVVVLVALVERLFVVLVVETEALLVVVTLGEVLIVVVVVVFRTRYEKESHETAIVRRASSTSKRIHQYPSFLDREQLPCNTMRDCREETVRPFFCRWQLADRQVEGSLVEQLVSVKMGWAEMRPGAWLSFEEWDPNHWNRISLSRLLLTNGLPHIRHDLVRQWRTW